MFSFCFGHFFSVIGWVLYLVPASSVTIWYLLEHVDVGRKLRTRSEVEAAKREQGEKALEMAEGDEDEEVKERIEEEREAQNEGSSAKRKAAKAAAVEAEEEELLDEEGEMYIARAINAAEALADVVQSTFHAAIQRFLFIQKPRLSELLMLGGAAVAVIGSGASERLPSWLWSALAALVALVVLPIRVARKSKVIEPSKKTV